MKWLLICIRLLWNQFGLRVSWPRQGRNLAPWSIDNISRYSVILLGSRRIDTGSMGRDDHSWPGNVWFLRKLDALRNDQGAFGLYRHLRDLNETRMLNDLLLSYYLPVRPWYRVSFRALAWLELPWSYIWSGLALDQYMTTSSRRRK